MLVLHGTRKTANASDDSHEAGKNWPQAPWGRLLEIDAKNTLVLTKFPSPENFGVVF